MIYVALTFVVLLFLNIYCAQKCQQLFYSSKETEMLQKCQSAAQRIAQLDAISSNTVSDAVSDYRANGTRIIFTDEFGAAVYDSATPETQQYILLPEVRNALAENDVFSWNYHDGAMRSSVAVPVYSYGVLAGCVYLMEYDTEQGALINSIQTNIFWASVLLAVVVILLAFGFASVFTKRLQAVLSSIRTIRNGDYSMKLDMDGSDEIGILAQEFNSLSFRLRVSEEKRQQFVSDASHELKTPLASIRLLTDSILNNDMDIQTVREFVGDIGNEADRLNHMSQKLLSLSRMDDESDGEYEITEIAPTVQKVVRMLSAIAQAQNVTIETKLSDGCTILILEDDLYHIVFNLAENGIKYNVPSGKLLITLQREGDEAILKVSDTGVGIPEEALSHIFERFYRVDKDRSRKSGGSGLGLSIVHRMVKRNGGTIQVESPAGQGTTFTVNFPICDVDEVSQ